ncbi:MAG: hypothetical protein WA139_05185 [Candidatus Aenigmatarchaeota archaeon]
MINEMRPNTKNYAIKSDAGKEEGNGTVIAVPIEFDKIPELARNGNVDCIVRVDTNEKSIYRIHYGNNIAKEPGEIKAAIYIFGLDNPWTFAKNYDFETDGFNA